MSDFDPNVPCPKCGSRFVFVVDGHYCMCPPYKDTIEGQEFPYYRITITRYCDNDFYHFDSRDEADRCGRYLVSLYGGYNGHEVVLSGLDQLPEGAKVNDQGDWL